jgi:tryptophan-rich sensory protein
MNEGLGGAIFVVWWIGMWYLGLFVAQSDPGAAVVMGLPLFVLAVLFIIAWFMKRRAAQSAERPDISRDQKERG